MRARHTFPAPSVVALLLAFCLALTSCGLFGIKATPDAVRVGDNGADVTVAGVRVVVPAGAAPVGTPLGAAFEDREPTGADGANLKTLAKAFKITLGDGIQPSKPLTVTVPVEKGQLIAQQSADTPTTVAMMVLSEGASMPDLVQATWNPDEGTITAEVPHLSWVWPVQLDLGAIMRTVRDSIMQSIGIEYAKPDCVDKPVTIGASTYTVVSPAQAWLCVGAANGSLTVEASPNSPIPFMTTTSPSASGTNGTDVSVSTAFSVALGRSLGYTTGSRAIMMPGASARFAFAGTPAEITVGFSQYPAMLLASILARTLEVAAGKFDSIPLEVIAAAGCMQNVLDTSQVGKALSPEMAGGIVKSFYACVGSVTKLSFAAQIVLGILSAGPQFLVASVLGIINEFTGGANFTATITASMATGDGSDRAIGPSTPSRSTPGLGGPRWYSFSELQAASWRNGFDTYRELTIKNTAFPESINAWYSTGSAYGHPNSAEWVLRGKCSKLEVWVGQNADSPERTGPSHFTVTLDNSVAAERDANFLDEAQKIELDVTGMTRVRFQDERTNRVGAYNVWGSPRVYCTDNPSPKD